MFGKWGHFAKYNVENTIVRRMQDWYRLLPPSYFFDTSPSDDELMDEIKKRQKREDLYDYVLFLPLEIAQDEEALKWARMIKADPDLNNYIRERFDYFIRLAQKNLKKLKRRRFQFDSLA